MDRSNVEHALLDKLKESGDFRENLAVFAKENFSGKVSYLMVSLLSTC
jgi:hypothetical protein